MSKDSSSDDESQYKSQLHLPNMNVYNKHKRNSSRTNLAKAGKKATIAGKKLMGNKSTKVSDLARHSYVSNSSSVTNNDSDFDSDDSDYEPDPHLPQFQFKAKEDHVDDDEGSDDFDIDKDANPEQLEESDSDADSDPKKSDPKYEQETEQRTEQETEQEPYSRSDQQEFRPQPENENISEPRLYWAPEQSSKPHNSHHTEDDDSGNDEVGDLHTNLSRNSMTSKSRKFFRRGSLLSSRSLGHNETDITDQLHPTPSNDSRSKARDTFKDILRKVALADQGADGSNGDTFIGSLIDNNDTYGLGGGGLVPGASRLSRDRPHDEESGIGMNDDIELQKLNFAQLNNEARNLINVHVPEDIRQEAQQEMIQLSTGSSSDTIVKEKDEDGNDIEKDSRHDHQHHDDSRSSKSKSRQKDHEFYAPNPDLFLRSNINHDEGDFMMLDEDGGHIAPPNQVQAGVLSSLLKLYQNPQEEKSSSSLTPGDERESFEFDEGFESRNSSTLDINRIKDGIKLGGKKVYNKIPGMKRGNSSFNVHGSNEDMGAIDEDGMPSFHNAKPKVPKKATINPANVSSKVGKKIKKSRRKSEQLRITVHIADILQRQRFIMVMCKALMLYGAPTHRLEEYMIMTSRVLEIDGQFIYFPGCMIMAFGDAATRTSEVHLVKCSQGVNLSKLSETHLIYKGVIHDLMGVDEASAKLDAILRKKNIYPPWVCVFLYGFGSSMVCPFAFGGGWVDIPIAFGVGLCVGYLQFFVSSMSNLYSSVFEVTSSIVVSFVARAIGSINGGNLFCFSAIAQGSLALILPGYIILCGSLELQSRNLVAGGVRMFYAIIYSLFLGFGITLGSALYGWVDSDSTSRTSCPAHHQTDARFRILFVPLFTTCLGLINQAELRQLPVMIVIAATGYVGNYFAGQHFVEVTEFTASIGAFIVGILGNLYSRIGKGLAVSAMLPAIFVQVPSGIASQSSLLSGIQAADLITNDTSQSLRENPAGALSFGATMVEVSIGISVGLFAAALVVYPFGKKKTGLFSL